MIGPSTHVFENKKIHFISNGNRTEWSPLRSVIIRVIKKIRQSRRGSPICLIMSMITDLSTLDISPPANVLKKMIYCDVLTLH